MRTLTAIAIASLFSVAAILTGGCSTAVVGADNIALKYTPTADDIGSAKFFGQVPAETKIYVEPVADNRDNKSAIGQDAEDRTPPIIYMSKDSPTDLVRSGVIQELKNANIKVVDDKAGANKVLSLSLTKFDCEIHGLFHSEVIADAEIKDASGASLWKAPVRGYDEHFGRNSNMENVGEGLSNASGKLAASILGNPDAMKALH